MATTKTALIIPFLLIAVGAGWLISATGIGPKSIVWIWTLGLGAIGLLAFLVGGFNKVTVVIGPLFLLASLLSVLRQTERLSLNVEIPLLILMAGLLLLLANLAAIPFPTWIDDPPNRNKSSGGVKRTLP